MVNVDIFRHREGNLRAVCFARADHGEFTNVVDPFFDDYPRWILQKVPEVIAVGSLFWCVQLDLTFTIVAKGCGLDHAGKADGLDCAFQAFCGVRIFKRHAG